MSAPTTWRGDDADSPRRSARVLRWYRLRLENWSEEFGERCKKSEAEGKKLEPHMYPALLDGLADWYAERPDHFLTWKADEEFRGGWYQLGAWSLNYPAMTAALRQAAQEVEAALRRQAYAVAGPITEATVDAALAHLEGSAPLTPEGHANSLYALDDPRRTALLHNHWRAADHWPRNCHRCGHEFKPAKPGQKRTCGDCLAKAKAEREEAKRPRA